MFANLEPQAATALVFLLEATWKGTVLLALAALLVFLLRRSSAARRHLVWACALAGLVALPVSLLLLPAWRVNGAGVPWIAPGFGLLAATVQPQAEKLPDTEAASPDTWSAKDEKSSYAKKRSSAPVTGAKQDARKLATTNAKPDPSSPAAAGATEEAETKPSGSSVLWIPIAFAVWAIGAVAVFATFAAGHVVLRLMLRGARPVRDGEWHALANEAADRLGLTVPFALLRTDGILVPVATGIVRPRVLLPTGADAWPEELRRAVLLHELAHVQRHDCLTQAIAQLACAAFWFHPAVWWATSRLQTERERACDDRVLAARTRASDYADHLLGMVRSLRARRLAALGAVAFARPSSLEGRLLAVLDPRRDRRAVGRRAVVPAALAAALLVLPFAALEPVVASRALADGKREVRAPLPTDPNAFRPSQVVAVPEAASVAERAAWARDDAKRAGTNVHWIGWRIETTPTLRGGLLSDSHGISLKVLGRRGAFTLEDVLAGRAQGTADPNRHAPVENGVRPAVVLVRITDGTPDRVRVQTPELPADFRGEPLYWMDQVTDEQGFAWLKQQSERADDDRLRARFVESVGFMRRSELVAPWLTATFQRATSDDVRVGAAEGLSRHPSPEGARLLTDAAHHDRSPEVRRAVVEALGQFQTEDALAALIVLARAGDGNASTRRVAFDALGQKVGEKAPQHGNKNEPTVQTDGTWIDTGDPAAAEAPVDEPEVNAGAPSEKDGMKEEKWQKLSHAELDVQRQAIESLGRYPEAQSLPRLRQLAETSPHGDLRAQAVESIARLKSANANAALEQIVWKNSMSRARQAAVEMMPRVMPAEQALDKLSEIARTHPSRETRRMAVESLARVDSPRTHEQLSRIVMEGVDVDSRRQAVESLGRIADPKVDRELLEIARTHKVGDVRRQAVESLARRAGSGITEALLLIANENSSADARRQAVESLGRRSGSDIDDALMLIARENSSLDARRQAVESLGRREGDDVDQRLMEITRWNAPPDVQRQAVESLGRRGGTRARGLLVGIVRDHRSLDVQRQAVESLGRLEADVMPDLEQIARSHPSGEIRRQAVESMTRRDPDRALAILERILQKSE